MNLQNQFTEQIKNLERDQIQLVKVKSGLEKKISEFKKFNDFIQDVGFINESFLKEGDLIDSPKGFNSVPC